MNMFAPIVLHNTSWASRRRTEAANDPRSHFTFACAASVATGNYPTPRTPSPVSSSRFLNVDATQRLNKGPARRLDDVETTFSKSYLIHPYILSCVICPKYKFLVLPQFPLVQITQVSVSVRNYLADMLSKSRGKVASLSQMSGRLAAQKSVPMLTSRSGLTGTPV